MPSFKIIRLPVLEKKIFKGFYHIWVWWPSWSCDLENNTNFGAPFPRRLHIKPGFDWPRGFREQIFENGGRTPTDELRLDGYTISSPCEPNCSGELKTAFYRRGTDYLSHIMRKPVFCIRGDKGTD